MEVFTNKDKNENCLLAEQNRKIVMKGKKHTVILSLSMANV